MFRHQAGSGALLYRDEVLRELCHSITRAKSLVDIFPAATVILIPGSGLTGAHFAESPKLLVLWFLSFPISQSCPHYAPLWSVFQFLCCGKKSPFGFLASTTAILCQGQEAMREVRRRGMGVSVLRSNEGWALQVLPMKGHLHPLCPFGLSHFGICPKVSGVYPPPLHTALPHDRWPRGRELMRWPA